LGHYSAKELVDAKKRPVSDRLGGMGSPAPPGTGHRSVRDMYLSILGYEQVKVKKEGRK
jgi:hypothetical protein